MFYAKKVLMKPGCGYLSTVEEIDKIYVELLGWKSKAEWYDYLRINPGTIAVGKAPYPLLIPALSKNNEKFVKSTPNSSGFDNLLSLR